MLHTFLMLSFCRFPFFVVETATVRCTLLQRRHSTLTRLKSFSCGVHMNNVCVIHTNWFVWLLYMYGGAWSRQEVCRYWWNWVPAVPVTSTTPLSPEQQSVRLPLLISALHWVIYFPVSLSIPFHFLHFDEIYQISEARLKANNFT